MRGPLVMPRAIVVRRCRNFGVRVVGAMMVICAAQLSEGASAQLTPTQDTWMFGSGTTNAVTHNGEGLRLADSTGSPNTPGIIMLQFNLAQLPANAQINSAHFELFLVSAASSTTNNIFVDGYTNADVTGAISFDETTLSRAQYSSTPALTNEFDSVIANYAAGVLGNSDAMPALNQFYASSSANGTELQHLQSVYDVGGATRNVIFQLWAPNVTGNHERMFEDREGTLTGNMLNAPRLVVDYSIIPEPSSLIILLIGSVAFIRAGQGRS